MELIEGQYNEATLLMNKQIISILVSGQRRGEALTEDTSSLLGRIVKSWLSVFWDLGMKEGCGLGNSLITLFNY